MVFASEIEIANADETWTAGIAAISFEALDSSDATFTLPNEAVLCHVDETWSYYFNPLAGGVVDSSEASFAIPVDAQICHADEILGNDLVSVEIGGGSVEPTKTPVLFVPGFLGTKIKDIDNNFLWLDLDRINNPLRPESYTDGFLDPLQFNENLVASDPNLSLSDVINKESYIGITFNYTEGLINEFKDQGYVEGRDFFTFPYDWRYGVSGTYPIPPDTSQRPLANSDLLAAKINELAQISPTGKVDVIAHSLGSLVVKKYIMQESDPKIGKLVNIGVPNLGAVKALKILLMGDNLGIIGLNTGEIKKIGRNLPVAYDLSPSQAYFDIKGSYYRTITFGDSGWDVFGVTKDLNYQETKAHLATRDTNAAGIASGSNLRTSEFDYFDSRTKGVDVYDIVGCKTPTIGRIIDYQNREGHISYDIDPVFVSGDDTAPFESADSIPADSNKKFYVKEPKHGQMPSQNGPRQKIVNIISGSQLNAGQNIISRDQLTANPDFCNLYGREIIIKSPVDIEAFDQHGNRAGAAGANSSQNEIPGASFEIINGHQYVYLPTGEGQLYTINLVGTGDGTFTLIDKKIEGNNVAAAVTYVDVPVVLSATGNLDISSASPTLTFDVDNNGTKEKIPATAQISGAQAADITPPQTTVTINGAEVNEYYRRDAVIQLLSVDYGNDNPAGVASINHALDGVAATPTAASEATVTVAGEGRHALAFFGVDNLGNREAAKTIGFTIDKTPPTIAWQGGPAADTSYYPANLPATPTCLATDSGSGPKSCAVDGYDVAPGAHTMTATAYDFAGNKTEEKRTYAVTALTLKGFYPPVDMGGVYNIAKNGSTVPLKFEIFSGATELTDISLVKNLTYAQIVCNANIITDDIETIATGGTVLRYDAIAGQFVYNWKTPAIAGRCYRLALTAVDGSILLAYFKLK